MAFSSKPNDYDMEADSTPESIQPTDDTAQHDLLLQHLIAILLPFDLSSFFTRRRGMGPADRFFLSDRSADTGTTTKFRMKTTAFEKISYIVAII